MSKCIRNERLWLHGRSEYTQRAYRADVERFRAGAGKPLAALTLGNLQEFGKVRRRNRLAERASAKCATFSRRDI